MLPLALVGLGIWRLWPKIEEYRVKDERAALRVLEYFASINADYSNFNKSINDRTEDGDYWTGDVAGLFRGNPGTANEPLAKADAAPLSPLVPKPAPYHGYYFVAVKRDGSIHPPQAYGIKTDESGRKVLNPSRFAICAYPAEYGWRHRLTFVINERFFVTAFDNGGTPIIEWPSRNELTEQPTEQD